MTAPKSFRAPDNALDDGDIVEGLHLPTWSKDGTVSTVARRALVTSNGCHCEEYLRLRARDRGDAAKKLRVHVAPLRNPDGSETKLQQIRDGEVLRLFWLYGDPDGSPIGDQIVDLGQETSVPAWLVVDKARRLGTIASWQWHRLLIHLAVERWHEKPENIFRPELVREGDT